jgi:tetratricopeptide (TPR) repeat protein
MSRTRLSVFLDGVLEAGWLAAVIVTPLFFNIYSSRVFEPDKLTTLRSIALVMAAVWLVRWLEEWVARRGERGATGAQPRITWRTPLILPTLLTVLAYLVSTALSVNPYTSFFGSYQRLQGTFTTFSYILIFLIILERMRTRAQVDRFVTTLILNSLPIALYGFVQHSGRDPLPWGGNVTTRVASNMGNAIFVAAYLIMVAPLVLSRVVEAFRAILTEEKASVADILRAAVYIFIFLVQVIAIWYTKSRGPLLGLLFGVGLWMFVGLLALQRQARQGQPGDSGFWSDLGRGALFGLGSLVAALGAAAAFYFAARALTAEESSLPAMGALGVALLVILGAWLAMIVNRQGWRWLWISALVMVVFFALGFFAVNPGGPLNEWAVQQPSIGRIANVLQAESGTGKVRALIWEGALQLILPHEPIAYPPTLTRSDWQADPFNAVRPLVGYGPESMYVAYNPFYPALLGHYESRTASPDRSHNETLDTLVITGVPGFVAYLWLFGSLFYFSLRWLNLLPDSRRLLFFVLLAVGGVLAAVIASLVLGVHFFGLAIPMGITAGLFIYLLVCGFSVYRETHPLPALPAEFILLAGLFSSFVAHFIEMNFGIAIASTRTTFWALAGVFVLLGLQRIADREEPSFAGPAPTSAGPARGRKRRRQGMPLPSPRRRTSYGPGWLWPTLGAALIGALILGTLAYDFVNNIERLTSPAQILWHSLTVVAINGPVRTSLGILMVVGVTWLALALLSVSQIARTGVFRNVSEQWTAALIVLLIALLIGMIFGLALASQHARVVTATLHSVSDVIAQAGRIADQLVAYYALLAALMLLGGLALSGERLLPTRWGTPAGVVTLLIALLGWLVLAFIGASGGATAATRLSALLLVFLGAAGAVTAVLLVYYLFDPAIRSRLVEVGWGWIGVALAGLLLFLAPVAAYQYNMRPIRADTIYKQGNAWEDQNQWTVVIPHYEAAIALAPREDFYYLYLGRAWLEYAGSLTDTTQQDQALRQTEQVLLQAQTINPLNTDHSANLARMYRSWADMPAAADSGQRDLLLQLSAQYYDTATRLSPHNPILWNEWATLNYYYLQDSLEYQRCISQSLELDPGFDQTWLIVGDVRAREGDLEGAAVAYRTALDLKPDQPRVWAALGRLYLQLGDNLQAASVLSQSIQLAPEASDVWETHELLAIARYRAGDVAGALEAAQMALLLAPETEQARLQQLVLQLQQPVSPTQEAP